MYGHTLKPCKYTDESGGQVLGRLDHIVTDLTFSVPKMVKGVYCLLVEYLQKLWYFRVMPSFFDFIKTGDFFQDF